MIQSTLNSYKLAGEKKDGLAGVLGEAYDRLSLEVFTDLTSILMEWTVTQLCYLLKICFGDKLERGKNTKIINLLLME